MRTRNGTTADDVSIPDQEQATFGTTPDHASRRRHGWLETDQGEYEFVPAFPALSEARTTFHVVDLGDEVDAEKERQFERLWRLQHNRGHAWDDHAKTTVRNDATYRRCAAILQQCEVPDWAEAMATTRVIRENLTGFSRHYAGADGACVGFALLAIYDNPDEARQSYITDRVPSVVPGLDAEDVDGLIDYVFRTYGGRS